LQVTESKREASQEVDERHPCLSYQHSNCLSHHTGNLMIGKLKGVVDSLGEDWIIVDVHGVGYQVQVKQI